MREIVLDTETTGLDPHDGHRIVEIGAIELVHLRRTGRTFHHYLNPERDMPPEAFAVHGLSTEFLSTKPLFSDVFEEFCTFIEGARLVIHNASFDMKFLNFELARVGRPEIGKEHVLDTLPLARKKHPGGPNSLDALCRRYGIDNSQREKHGALLDSDLLVDVYVELMGGKQVSLGFSATDTLESVDPALEEQASAPARPTALPSRLTQDERIAHRAFVETLGPGAVWHSYADLLYDRDPHKVNDCKTT